MLVLKHIYYGDRLFGWLTDWLTGWLAGLLACWLAGLAGLALCLVYRVGSQACRMANRRSLSC